MSEGIYTLPQDPRLVDAYQLPFAEKCTKLTFQTPTAANKVRTYSYPCHDNVLTVRIQGTPAKIPSPLQDFPHDGTKTSQNGLLQHLQNMQIPGMHQGGQVRTRSQHRPRPTWNRGCPSTAVGFTFVSQSPHPATECS